jgi:hypothetical protein
MECKPDEYDHEHSFSEQGDRSNGKFPAWERPARSLRAGDVREVLSNSFGTLAVTEHPLSLVDSATSRF